MGFFHRLGSALIQYGIIGSLLALALLIGLFGYGAEDIRAELEGMLEDDYIQYEEEDELSDFTFELVILLAPIPIFLYRYFAIEHTGLIGEIVLFFLAGANPILGLAGFLLYVGTSKN